LPPFLPPLGGGDSLPLFHQSTINIVDIDETIEEKEGGQGAIIFLFLFKLNKILILFKLNKRSLLLFH
jgi:hypothetical protein